MTDSTARHAYAVTRTGELIALHLGRPGLVPACSIDLEAGAAPVAAPGLDPGRAGLWLLAAFIEREPGVYDLFPYDPAAGTSDGSEERCAVDVDAVDHHLLVLEGPPGPRLQAAIAAGEVDEPFPGAFVTRRPIALSVARGFAGEARFVCGIAGRDQADRVLGNYYVHEFAGDALRFIRVSVPDRIRIERLPPEWTAALASATLDLDSPTERIVLTDVCTEVRALDVDGGRPESAAALEAEFRRLLDREAQTVDGPERRGSRARPVLGAATILVLVVAVAVACLGYLQCAS
jgi:hypothetical protein